MIRILCIDDDSDDVTLIRRWIGTGFRVVWAPTIEQADILLRARHFDICLLDLGMIGNSRPMPSGRLPFIIWSGLQIDNVVWLLSRDGHTCRAEGDLIRFQDGREMRFCCKDELLHDGYIAALIEQEIEHFKKKLAPKVNG